MFKFVYAVALTLFTFAALPALADDAGAVRHLMMATFDKPESRLIVEPIP